MIDIMKIIKRNSPTAKLLAYWLKRTGMKQAELAEKVGLEQGTISNMIRGVRGIKAEHLEKMCDVFGITLAEFFAGQDSDVPEVVFVPLVKAVPRAGLGGLETDGGTVALYSFHSEFIKRKQGTPETMRLFRVEGDSMEPTIRSDDMVMINLRMTDVRSGNIYLIRFEGELMLKRLERRPAGRILIRSDNPGYEDIEVHPDENSVDFVVFGRMVWLCREF